MMTMTMMMMERIEQSSMGERKEKGEKQDSLYNY